MQATWKRILCRNGSSDDEPSALMSELIRFARGLLPTLTKQQKQMQQAQAKEEQDGDADGNQSRQALREGYALLTQLCDEIQILGDHTVRWIF